MSFPTWRRRSSEYLMYLRRSPILQSNELATTIRELPGRVHVTSTFHSHDEPPPPIFFGAVAVRAAAACEPVLELRAECGARLGPNGHSARGRGSLGEQPFGSARSGKGEPRENRSRGACSGTCRPAGTGPEGRADPRAAGSRSACSGDSLCCRRGGSGGIHSSIGAAPWSSGDPAAERGSGGFSAFRFSA